MCLLVGWTCWPCFMLLGLKVSLAQRSLIISGADPQNSTGFPLGPYFDKKVRPQQTTSHPRGNLLQVGTPDLSGEPIGSSERSRIPELFELVRTGMGGVVATIVILVVCLFPFPEAKGHMFYQAPFVSLHRKQRGTCSVPYLP